MLQHVLSVRRPSVLHAASHQHLWIVLSQTQKFSGEKSILNHSNCTYENKHPSLFLKAAQVKVGFTQKALLIYGRNTTARMQRTRGGPISQASEHVGLFPYVLYDRLRKTICNIHRSTEVFEDLPQTGHMIYFHSKCLYIWWYMCIVSHWNKDVM